MNPIKKILFQYGIPFIGRLCYSKNKYVNVIYYHDIVQGKGNSFQQTNINVFKRQMEYIASHGYKTFRFDDLNNETIKYDPKTVVIAFDDGWKSNYIEIYEFMRSLGIKYSIYLAVKEIGVNPDYLTWKQVWQMHNEGLVGFGTHTYTHPHVNSIDNIDVNVEFNKADSIFKDHLGYQPLDFCYPYGTYTNETNEYISRKLLYKRIYTSDLMYSYSLNGKIIFGRNGINGEEPFGVFVSKLKGYYNVWMSIIKRYERGIYYKKSR